MGTARILVKRTACTGCRLCELACSFVKTKAFGPRSSGIWIEIDDAMGKDVPHVCQQNVRACRTRGDDRPKCVAACPAAREARPPIYWDDALSVVTLSPRRDCISCQECGKACPFGSIRFDPSQSTLVKCDLCGGEPECVKVCVTGAIKFAGKA